MSMLGRHKSAHLHAIIIQTKRSLCASFHSFARLSEAGKAIHLWPASRWRAWKTRERLIFGGVLCLRNESVGCAVHCVAPAVQCAIVSHE
jgi:hypothetical protein